MPGRPAKLVPVLAGIAALLATCSQAVAAPAVTGHFPLASPVDTNSKIVAGPDGNMWLAVHGANNDVASVTPGGKVEEFELEGIDEPSGIAVGPEKKLWVTATNKVASFSPSDPKGTSKAFTINDVTSNNPIVAGPDGQMWDAASNNIVHFNPSDPEKAQSFSVPGLSPRDIDVAGSLLVVSDSANPRIVTMTTTGVEKDYAIGYVNGGVTEGASQGLAGSPTGQIGFSQPGAAPEQIGLITPPNAAQSFDRDGDPFGVAFGSDAAFWIALSGPPAGVQRLTSTGESTFLGGFPAGFTPRQIAAGPGNTIWVTIENPAVAWEIVRISGLEPPVGPGGGKTAPPQTKIAKGPKKKVKTKGKVATVTFRFNSSTAGAAFECALTKSKKGKRPSKRRFKTCKSPKSYKLKPGKYSFGVRAVSAGGTDSTPATFSFRVIHIR